MEGKKHDLGKLRMDLIPPEAIVAMGEVLTYGQIKYPGDHNWKHIEDAENRYYSALMRHLMSYKMGETFDKESKLSHLKHALANVAFLLEFENKKLKNE